MNIGTMKLAELRKLAEEKQVEGFESLNRAELLAALKDSVPSETPKEVPTENSVDEPLPVLAKSYAPIGSKAHAMKLKLQAEEKVRIFIPLAGGEKQGVTQSVILNGYPLYIRKGEYVDVPQSVAEVLEIKLKNKMMVENHPSRVGGDREVKMTTFGSN